MNQKRVVEFSATHRIPAIYESSAVVRLGGLMSYGPSAQEMSRRAASYIDRIFKGAKPSDLPAEQPTKYEFAMNLATARALGAVRMIIEADPGATPFYERMGARHAGFVRSQSIAGRMLPRMQMYLEK